MSFFPIQATFIKGELSPLVHARVDVDLYQSGLAQCENWVVLPQGGVTRRPGTRFVNACKDHGKKSRLVNFQFNTEVSYALEIGHEYIRFYKDQGLLVNDSDPDSITPVELVTPYSEDQIFDLSFTQKEDTLYIAHKDHEPRELTRSSEFVFSLAVISFTGKPSEWVAGNFPQRVAFYEDRLAWAATPKEPQTVWFSKTSEYKQLTVGTVDDSAMKLTIQAGQVNAIQWLAEDRKMQIGTTAATRTLGGTGDGALTPTNIQQARHTTDGSSSIQPIQTGAVTLFIGDKRQRLREFFYSFENDRQIAPDLSLLSEHILRPKVVEMAFQQDPFPIVWLCLENGELAGVTYERDQKVAGWHRHRLGGDADGQGFAAVESICTVSGADHDELWMVVRRTIDGQARRYIEFLTRPFQLTETAQDQAFFVDSGLSYDGAATTAITGLDHLEGETVAVLNNGAVHPKRDVASGGIALQTAGSKVQAGLPYTSSLQTLRLGFQSRDGTILSRNTNIKFALIDVYETNGLLAGVSPDALETVSFREGGDLMDTAPPLRSDSQTVSISDQIENAGQLFLVQQDPVPATVRAITPAVDTE